MKHILPVLGLILSICVFCMSALSLVLIVLAARLDWIAATAFALPCLLTAFVLALFAFGVNLFLVKHILCRIALAVSVIDIAVTATAFILLMTL